MSVMNKKFDRFKQWGKEKMGGDIKTDMSTDFKAMEAEMDLRQAGTDKLHKSMQVYMKNISYREKGDDKEMHLPAACMGSAMLRHGEDFEPDSEYGNCMNNMGTAQEKIARATEAYIANANTSWSEALQRSTAQFKEYQAARKKLDQRRLAYDTSLHKVQKAKKEDYRMEEELRSQKAKYEESSEDVYRRMEDIKEAEVENVSDLTAFMEAELEYHDRCREILLQLKREWPISANAANGKDLSRSRSRNTAHSFADRVDALEDEPVVPRRIPMQSSRQVSASNSIASSPRHELPAYELPARPGLSRSSTRDASPSHRLSRVPTDTSMAMAGRSQLRSVQTAPATDPYEEAYDGNTSSPDRYNSGRSVSPATSFGSRADSVAGGTMRKAPPPPPPSRSKKPPPPPPMKRSVLSSSDMSYQ